MELMNYVERLLDDSLSLQCTLQFRDFISKNGAQIDDKNKGLMDNCFDCIQEAITRNTLDSVVEINLKDILLLRRQNWQYPHMQEKISDVTWKEIYMNLNGSGDALKYCEDTESSQVPAKTCTHLIQTQQSTDSGFGEDEILWECEEEFRKDLQEINGFSKARLEDIPEAECPDKELLAGIQIIGKDQSLVEEAEQILRTHFNRRKSVSPPAPTEKPDIPASPADYMPPQPPKGDNCKLPDHWYLPPPPPAPPSMTPAPQEKSSVPTSPVDYMPPQPPKGDNYKLPDHWYLLPPPPPPPPVQEPDCHPVRLNRQLSEVKQRYEGMVIRQPIGAGISPDALQEIEKSMPDGIFTARGRRTMFGRYRSAMGNTSESEAVCYKYSREQLLAYSDSIYAREPPPEWSYLEKIYPDICLKKVSSYFDRK
ncbi:formin-A-like, partial [Pecten maximus]|uniref:formin-A-like n=1 Tax=Pecten maximus TaxID=6579 RepID=UPI001458707A